MMLTVGIALVAPLAPAQTLFARPLATPTEPVEWCWGDCGGNDETPDIDVCFEEMTGSDTQNHRCDLVSGRACREMCTASAVASSCLVDLGSEAAPRALARCGAERLDLCRDQCDSGGAGFCEVRGKKDPPAWGHCKESKPGQGGGHSDKGDLNHTHDELDTRPECEDKPGGGPSRPTPEVDPDEGEDDGVIYVDIDLCWEFVPDPIPG